MREYVLLAILMVSAGYLLLAAALNVMRLFGECQCAARAFYAFDITMCIASVAMMMYLYLR